MTEITLHTRFLKEQLSKKQSLEFVAKLKDANFDKFMTFMGYKLTGTQEDMIYDKHLIRFCVVVKTNIVGKSIVTIAWVPLNPDGSKLGPGTVRVLYTKDILCNFDSWLDAFKMEIIGKEHRVNVLGRRYLVMMVFEEVGLVPDFLEGFW